MKMGLFSRITDIFKANVNDALDQAEDPEKMLKQMVLEMEESVNKATLSVAQAIANEKNLERKLEKAKKEQSDWQQKAMQALQAGREDLAKAALEKKAIAEKNFNDLNPIYQQASATSTKLRSQLDQLRNKLEEARSRQSTLIARSQAAKAQKQLAQNVGGIGTDSFSKFEKFESKIESLESEAVAFEELSSGTTDLDAEFKKLSSNATVDDELLKLKSSMGLLDDGKNENKLLNS
jgi:phage shock protein A